MRGGLKIWSEVDRTIRSSLDNQDSLCLDRIVTDDVEIASIILDPSFLFTYDAIELLVDQSVRPFLVLSDSLGRLLDSAVDDESARSRLNAMISLSDGDEVRPDVLAIRTLTEGLRRFSYRETLDLDLESHSEVARGLIEALRSTQTATTAEEFLMDITGDEYAFLVSHSLGMFVGRGWERLEAAGVQIVEIARDEMQTALVAIRGHIPDGVLRIGKQVVNFPSPRSKKQRYFAFGGRIAAIFLLHLGTAAQITFAGIQGGAGLIVGDP